MVSDTFSPLDLLTGDLIAENTARFHVHLEPRSTSLFYTGTREEYEHLRRQSETAAVWGEKRPENR